MPADALPALPIASAIDPLPAAPAPAIEPLEQATPNTTTDTNAHDERAGSLVDTIGSMSASWIPVRLASRPASGRAERFIAEPATPHERRSRSGARTYGIRSA